jgi:hypothetical protein
MGFREAAQRHDRVLQELNEERAAALRRIGRTLESLIRQARESAERVDGLAGAERERELRRYRETRRRAVRYRWYLEVQREAVGMRHHGVLDEFYRVPGPIDA